MKKLLLLLALAIAPAVHAVETNTQVLLAPVEATQVGAFDWGVVVLPEVLPAKGSTADRGSLKVNLDLAKFFQEGYAIYSITPIDRRSDGEPALLFVMVRPKGR